MSFINKWGLALAGGGTRGAYHIGVWQALLELGIDVGAVVGTSIGSVNGALFVQNDFEKAVEIWKNIEIKDVLDIRESLSDNINLFDYKNILPLVQEFIRTNGLQTMPLQRMMEGIIDEKKIRNSDIEYGLNTTSVSDVESVELFACDIPEGKIVDSIMASACFPGLQKRYIEDKAYADGGIMNNLPLDMLFKRGYKNIIAVDVGGVGIVKNSRCFDTNIIYIKCREPLLGLFDFNKEAIGKSIKQGYYDTYRSFGRLVGDNYYFNVGDYCRARQKYSEEILKGIEIAAEAFGINKIAVYKTDALIKGITEKFEFYKKRTQDETTDSLISLKNDSRALIVKLTEMILQGRADNFNNKIVMGVLGNRLTAANAIAYFLNNKDI